MNELYLKGKLCMWLQMCVDMILQMENDSS